MKSDPLTVLVFVQPVFSMAGYRDQVFCLFICLFVPQSLNFCVIPNLDLNDLVHFPRTIKAKVMMLGIHLHFRQQYPYLTSIYNLWFMDVVHVNLHGIT